MKNLIQSTLVLSSIMLFAFSCVESKDFDSPCALISLDDVKKRFNLDANMEIDFEDKVNSFPTCSFSWKDGGVTKSMDVGGQKIDINLDSELLIVMVKDANESMYERSITAYSDGQVEDTIGDRATWSDKRSQLTFLSKSHLFHVHVRVSNDKAVNRKHAIEIAESFIAKI